MGMTIEESISELKWVRKVNEEILKTDAKEIDVDSAWIKHWENVIKSLDLAIETMSKYQKIVQIMERTVDDGTSMYDTLQEIEEVIEDGKRG